MAVLLLLVACGPRTRWDHTPREAHIVRSGETLFTIGWRYGEDPRDLARWNRLGNGSLIYPGQVIRLTPPSGERRASSTPTSKTTTAQPLPPIPTQPAPPWSWPAAGKVAVEFGKRPGTGTGILIDGTVGQSVKAAAKGTVVYSGSGLIGYGQLIIVKHNDTYLSAYGHNASLLVKEGQAVKKGQKIATMGEGPGGQPRLHFEIRRNGKPVNPRQFLPAR
jgi:lipoprotein NlpD